MHAYILGEANMPVDKRRHVMIESWHLSTLGEQIIWKKYFKICEDG